VPLSYVFATKQFETHPSWGATEIRIENKRHSHAVHFGSLIPFDLSVRIHPGVSFYRSPDDFAVYLVYLNNRDSDEWSMTTNDLCDQKTAP